MKRRATIPFKGERDYVQGPDLFNLLIERARSHGSPISGILFAVNQPLMSSEIEIVGNPTDVPWPVRLRASLDGRRITVQARSAGPSRQPELRTAYDEGPVRSRCRMEGMRLIFDGPSDRSFIETVVACNKLLLESLHAPEAGRWLFVRIELARDVQKFDGVELECISALGSRLFRSRIGDGMGDIYFVKIK